jgi:hypothetical protein
MSNFQDFVSTPGPADLRNPEVVVPAGTQPGEAMDALVTVFADSDERSAVRLVVGDVELGAVHRDTVLDLLGTTTKAGFGEGGDGLWLPGASTSARYVELACPVAGCPSAHKFVFTYDEERPPTCSVHPGTAFQRVT